MFHNQEFGHSHLWTKQTYLHFICYHNTDDTDVDQFLLKKILNRDEDSLNRF